MWAFPLPREVVRFDPLFGLSPTVQVFPAVDQIDQQTLCAVTRDRRWYVLWSGVVEMAVAVEQALTEEGRDGWT